MVNSVSLVIKKEIIATEYEEDAGTDAKPDKNDNVKEKEFATIYDQPLYNDHPKEIVVHKTLYSNYYQCAYFGNISIPPPDVNKSLI